MFIKEDQSRDPLTEKIIGAAIEVHRTLGPGLLETAYEQCLCYELSQIGLSLVRQQQMPVVYKGVNIDCNFRVDMIVENQVIIELKACDQINSVMEAQLLTYMKLAHIRKGLLINFNVRMLKDGIQRFCL